MSIERYPADLVITDHDFRESGWKRVSSSTTQEGYWPMWQGFYAATRQAMEEGRQSHGKVLQLFADACSMVLSPKSINDPFKPLLVMERGRFPIPEDLSEADIMFFAQIVDAVDDPWLKARIADLIWLAGWQGFYAATRQAMEEGRQSHGKVLQLFADACSMVLSPKSINDPFKPLLVMERGRFPIPEDLSEADIMFFAQIVDAVDDPWLKARIADLIWLKQRPSEVRFALAAIDAYRLIPLSTETWVRDGRECWERAIGLSRMLGTGTGNRLTKIEAAIIQSFESTTKSDGFLGLWMADLLEENGLGRNHKTAIAQKLEALANEFDIEGDLHGARKFFGASARWFKAAGNEEKSTLMTVAVAESWAKEVVSRASSENPSHMAAASCYEEAIQTYRTIPRAQRSAHRIDERIDELRAGLSDSGDKSLGEMGVISTPGVDISRTVENSRNAVRGKSALEAFKAFANLHRWVVAKELRANSIKRLRETPLLTMITATMMSRDGRVTTKRPGMSIGVEPSADDEIVIRSEMIRGYGTLVSCAVHGVIWPALEVMLLEHRLREADFVEFASQSPIVPKGRERLFGKALFAGYDRDFVTALHVLTPQIEHMVRFHLKQYGAKTTTLDSNGRESENGLSTLMKLSAADKVFGEDLAFEIRALFCDAFGPALRNELAHGLLDYDAYHTSYAIYAWWLGLRLVFNSFLSTTLRSGASTGEGQEE